jgi:ubiquinone/menaquinone biosynthesis C-methylase UbiE
VSDSRSNFTNINNTYILRNNPIEPSRLIQQSDLYTKYEGGIFPELDHLYGITSVLDVACGPGGWALEVARLHPNIDVTGGDIDPHMITCAQDRARNLRLPNAHFVEMDIRQPLNLPGHSVDVINGRFLQGVLDTQAWMPFLRNCQRTLRSGGTLRLTEAAFAESNNADFNRLTSLLALAFFASGRSFSSDGQYLGLVYIMGQILRDAGYCNIRSRTWTVDYSYETDAYDAMFEHHRILYSSDVMGAFLIQADVISAEEYQALYDRAMKAFVNSSFTAISYYATITGEYAGQIASSMRNAP